MSEREIGREGVRVNGRGPVKNQTLSVAITELWATPGYRERNLAGCQAARARKPPRPDRTSLRERQQAEVRIKREANLRRMLTERMACAPRGLSAHQRQVLTLRFGLDGGGCRTLEEVGRHFGSTRSAVQQSEVRALRRLAWPAELRLIVSRKRGEGAGE